MPEHLKSVRINRFKRISDAHFDVGEINVVVGANNAGKSSVIQGLHFGVAILQTIGLSDGWPVGGKPHSTSLNPNQLIYSPSDDVYTLAEGGRLLSDDSKAISIEFTLSSGDTCSIRVRRGKNRNIAVSVSNPVAAKRLAGIKEPFSIFSPGLAGIAKRENYVSDGVLLRTLARGDANLVLRNILLRLWGTAHWEGLLSDLHDVFPGLELAVGFTKETDEFVDVKLRAGQEWVPLELAGTGILQAVQILSYIHNFAPSLIVLDEPDSHLHPNNQRLMCALLRKVATERGIQVLLTTHSRHVVDSIGGAATFLWIRKGTVDIAGPDDEIGVLLDIGALDVKERVGQPGTTAVLLTEDEITAPLVTVATESGFNPDTTVVASYYGVTVVKQLRPLVHIVQAGNPKAKVVVHRDRDFMTDEEVESWCVEIRKLGVEPFVTSGRDIESYFVNAKHLAAGNAEATSAEFESLVADVVTQMSTTTKEAYVNGRVEIARRSGTMGSLNLGKLATEAEEKVSKDWKRYAGKELLRAVRGEFRKRYTKNLSTSHASDELRDPTLVAIAKKLPRAKAVKS